jgi:acyl-CoA synthetase (NDP forming)
MFNPEKIAVVGVSTNPAKASSVIYHNLILNKERGILKAEVFPVNPKYDEFEGSKCYPQISMIPSRVDLAIIAIPAEAALKALEDAGKSGVPSAIIISSGFGEIGRRDLDEAIRDICKRTGIRVLGPNTVGILDTYSGVNTFFIPPFKKLPSGEEIESLPVPMKGRVAIVTQSGHLGEMIGDHLNGAGTGVRCIVGIGNQIDITIEDMIDFLGRDDKTKVIALYIETLRNGRRFIDVASKVSKRKPIVALKAGKTVAGAKAAYTHTASMVGDYQTYKFAFRQAGVLETESFEEMIDACKILERFPSADGKRVMVVTNAGGSGVLAADECERLGLEVRPFNTKELQRIMQKLSTLPFIDLIGKGNPFDATALARTEEFVKIFRTIADLRLHDLYLLIPTHQPPTIDLAIIDMVAGVRNEIGKPVVVCVMGEAALSKLLARKFTKAGIPAFPTPERTARALYFIYKYSLLKERTRPVGEVSLYENRVPWLNEEPEGPIDFLKGIKLLEEYGIPVAEAYIASDEAEAVEWAEKLGYPVVLKIISRQIIHKTDIGGVLVGLRDRKQLIDGMKALRKTTASKNIHVDGYLVQKMVQKGTEVLVGGFKDPIFGPIITFGIGGIYTELLHDFSLRVAPISESEAKAMIDELLLTPILKGYRGGVEANLSELSEIITSFSRILAENASIEQLEINPLIVTAHGSYCVDVRGIVRHKGQKDGGSVNYK